jgi:hypothetical protein
LSAWPPLLGARIFDLADQVEHHKVFCCSPHSLHLYHAAVLIQVDRFLGHDFGAFVQTVDVVAAVSSSSTLRNMPTTFRRRILHNENGRAGQIAVVHAETGTFALETAAA